MIKTSLLACHLVSFLFQLQSETFASINKCNLNKSKHLLLYSFVLASFFQRKHWGHHLYICKCQFLEPHMEILFQKNGNMFDLRKNILSRNKQTIGFNTLFHQYTEDAARATSRVKYCFSLFFIDIIGFLFKNNFVTGFSC